MKHHHITKVLYIFLIGILAVTAIAVDFSIQAQPAKALSPFIPYGGLVSGIPLYNPLPAPGAPPNPVCPFYYPITNVDPTNGLPPLFGVFIPITPPGITYDYNNLAIPGTPVLGGIVPVPCVGGIAPMPLYPLFYDLPDGGFYLTGTGAF